MVIIEYPHIRWRCQRCGECCKDQVKRKRRILLTDYDIARIKKDMVEEKFCKKIKPNGPYKYMMIQKDGSCIFLSNNRCTIYEKRPLICRFYPFTMIENESYVFQADAGCLGVNLGKYVTKNDFIELVEEAKRSIE